MFFKLTRFKQLQSIDEVFTLASYVSSCVYTPPSPPRTAGWYGARLHNTSITAALHIHVRTARPHKCGLSRPWMRNKTVLLSVAASQMKLELIDPE
jgi:hypothetical protein